MSHDSDLSIHYFSSRRALTRFSIAFGHFYADFQPSMEIPKTTNHIKGPDVSEFYLASLGVSKDLANAFKKLESFTEIYEIVVVVLIFNFG